MNDFLSKLIRLGHHPVIKYRRKYSFAANKQVPQTFFLLKQLSSNSSSCNSNNNKKELNNGSDNPTNKDNNTSGKDVAKQQNLSFEDMQPITKKEIMKFLTKMNLAYTEGFTCIVTSCLRHCRSKMKLEKLDQLYINSTTGFFVCQSCNKCGSWSELVENMYNLEVSLNAKKKLPACFTNDSKVEDILASSGSLKAQQLYEQSLAIADCDKEKVLNLLSELNLKDLKIETLKRYNIRLDADYTKLVLPLVGFKNKVVGVKVLEKSNGNKPERANNNNNNNNTTSETYTTKIIPRTDCCGIFGWNLLSQSLSTSSSSSSSSSDVILTCNEVDCMICHQEAGKLCISLSKEDSVLPQKVLPLLESVLKLLIYFGGDGNKWNNARQFAKKLNVKRCQLIRPDDKHPSAHEAFEKNLSLKKIFQSAKSIEHQSIITFQNIRRDLYLELSDVEHSTGVQWHRFPQLNSILKGHRRGELTIFTGPTGSGKTTFISDYSLDLCMQGVNTLWGSFEINNVRLVKTMLTQFAMLNLSKNLEKFDYYADRFEQLPMYFMTFHGQENIKKVIETMSHAVYVHDISHVVVDNLQFMLGLEDSIMSPSPASNASFLKFVDKFYRQDLVVAAFRKFATHMNCHVTLVIHPRKEKDSDELSVSSIFGSAKVSQEADNIIILQDKRLTSVRGRKYIQVAKNRFDGELGLMLLKFDKDSLSFSMRNSRNKEISSPSQHQHTTPPSSSSPLSSSSSESSSSSSLTSQPPET